jgi:hypothetical protein
MFLSDIGYRTKVYSDIRYNVGLCALQSDIGRSDIRLSPISLITDIGVSAHLCCSVLPITFCLPHSSFLVLPVQLCLSCLPVLSACPVCLSCSACPVLPALSACLVLPIPFFLSFYDCPILSCCAFPVPPGLFCLPSSA